LPPGMILWSVAYSELAFDGYRPPSFLESEGAIKVGVEFHSVSKTYNMAGCRLGFVVGNSEVIEALTRVKSNIDYGVFLPIQMAGISALRGPQDITRRNAAVYKARRDILVDGWVMDKPQATMFVWASLPKGYTSSEKFAEDILRQTGVALVPGVAFGRQGEGYVRIALVQDNSVIEEAVRRISDKFSF